MQEKKKTYNIKHGQPRPKYQNNSALIHWTKQTFTQL